MNFKDSSAKSSEPHSNQISKEINPKPTVLTFFDHKIRNSPKKQEEAREEEKVEKPKKRSWRAISVHYVERIKVKHHNNDVSHL